MLITCPNCQTQYSVSAQSMGQGRTVRCHNCNNTWHQAPVAQNQNKPRQPRSAPHAFPLPGLGQPYAQPPYPPPGYGAPPPGYPPPPQAAYGAQGAWGAAAPAHEAPPMQHPPVTQAPPPEPEADDDGDIFDTESLLAEIGGDAEDDEPDEPEVEERDLTPVVPDDELESVDDEDEVSALSQAELDDMFGDEDIPAISSVVSSDGEGETYSDPDDIPDPDDDDFPQSLTSDMSGAAEPAPRKKGGILKWILIVFVVLLLAAGGAAVVLKDMVVGMVPALAPVYEMIGLGEKLGEGLDIRDVGSERVTEAGVDTLVIRGVVANVSERPRTVPRIRVDLFDANGESVQSAVVDPVRIDVPSGEIAEFTARIEEPSPLARRLEVTFVERPKMEGQAQ